MANDTYKPDWDDGASNDRNYRGAGPGPGENGVTSDSQPDLVAASKLAPPSEIMSDRNGPTDMDGDKKRLS